MDFIPQIKSAINCVETQANANKRHAAQLSELRTAVEKFRVAQAAGAESTSDLYKAVAHALDRATSKDLIHKNKANRNKSRLARLAR